MPPKMKLHKEKGKLKSIPKASTSSSENAAPVPLESDTESRQQFEVELLWCIHQLQNALESGKLSQKQMQDTSKTLNTLMNNRTPLIKKRQLMRTTFGDYRTKMAEEERKYAKINSKICLVPGKPSKKSVFVKKAPFLISGKDFKFNFKLENTTENLAQLNIEEKSSDAIKEPISVSDAESKETDTKSELAEGAVQVENTTENLAQLNLQEKSPDPIKKPISVLETESKETNIKSESAEGAQKRKTESLENNVQDKNEEKHGEPPCKMFHYQKSKNEFRFNFTETNAE